MKVTKAVIPVAGLGTRFYPATKAVAKELLPVVDKPTILFNAEECVNAGITELILVTSPQKQAVPDFFAPSHEIEEAIRRGGHEDWLQPLIQLRDQLKITSVQQEHALGLGHAVLCAREAVGDEPFAVLLGDEILITAPGRPTGVAQLKKIAEKEQLSTVAVIEVPRQDVSKYGVVSVETKAENGVWRVNGVVEKPAVGDAPSNLALPGRYLFTPEIFACLKDLKPGRNGELQLSDAMHVLAQQQGMRAITLEGQCFDVGDKLGFLKANVELGLRHAQVGAEFAAYLKDRFGGRQ